MRRPFWKGMRYLVPLALLVSCMTSVDVPSGGGGGGGGSGSSSTGITITAFGIGGSFAQKYTPFPLKVFGWLSGPIDRTALAQVNFSTVGGAVCKLYNLDDKLEITGNYIEQQVTDGSGKATFVGSGVVLDSSKVQYLIKCLKGGVYLDAPVTGTTVDVDPAIHAVYHAIRTANYTTSLGADLREVFTSAQVNAMVQNVKVELGNSNPNPTNLGNVYTSVAPTVQADITTFSGVNFGAGAINNPAPQLNIIVPRSKTATCLESVDGSSVTGSNTIDFEVTGRDFSTNGYTLNYDWAKTVNSTTTNLGLAATANTYDYICSTTDTQGGAEGSTIGVSMAVTVTLAGCGSCPPVRLVRQVTITKVTNVPRFDGNYPVQGNFDFVPDFYPNLMISGSEGTSSTWIFRALDPNGDMMSMDFLVSTSDATTTSYSWISQSFNSTSTHQSALVQYQNFTFDFASNLVSGTDRAMGYKDFTLAIGVKKAPNECLSNPSDTACNYQTYTSNSVMTTNVVVRVFDVDAAPVGETGSMLVTEDSVANSVQLTYTDSDGDLAASCATSAAIGVSLGACSCNGSGVCSLTVTPDANRDIAGSFQWAVTTAGYVSTSQPVTMTVNITPVNDAPLVSNIADQTVNEDEGTGPLAFTITDPDTGDTHTVTLASSNTTLVPENTTYLNSAGTGLSRSVTVTPAANENGTSTITVTVTDSGGQSASDTFVLTVSSVNDLPTLTGLSSSLAVSEDTSTGALSFTIGDVETAVGALTVAGISSNTTLVPNGNIVFGGAGANRTVTITPAANLNGTANIEIGVTDGASGATSSTIALTVQAVNDAPVISGLTTNPTFDEDTSWVPSFDVSDVESLEGATNTYLLTFEAANGVWSDAGNDYLGEGLTIVAGANSTGSVTFLGTMAQLNSYLDLGVMEFTPTANFNGSNAATITLNDQGAVGLGGTLMDVKSITMNITAVNDTPTVSDITDQTINEDTSTSGITFTVADVETSADALVVTATSSNTSLLPNGNIQLGTISGGSWAITATPAANQFGTTIITVSASDGVASGQDTFVLTVNSVNDAPVVEMLVASRTVSEDSYIASSWVVSGISDVDHSGQQMTFIFEQIPVVGEFSVRIEPEDYSLITFLAGFGNTVVVTGTLVNINSWIQHNGFRWNPSSNWNGSLTFRTTVYDGGTPKLSDTKAISVTVESVNDPPEIDMLVSSGAVSEDGYYFIAASGVISGIRDVDVGSNNVTMKFDTANGTFRRFCCSPPPVYSGFDTSSLVVTGTISEVNSWLNSASVALLFQGDTNWYGSTAITMTVFDHGNSGSGGAKTTTYTLPITVQSVNDAPTFTVQPGNLTSSMYSSATTTFSIRDVDHSLACNGSYLSIVDISNGNALFNPLAGHFTFSAVSNSPCAAGSSCNCAVTFNGPVNQYGSETFKIRVSDGTATADSSARTVTQNDLFSWSGTSRNVLAGASAAQLYAVSEMMNSNSITSTSMGDLFSYYLPMDWDNDGDVDILYSQRNNSGSSSYMILAKNNGANPPSWSYGGYSSKLQYNWPAGISNWSFLGDLLTNGYKGIVVTTNTGNTATANDYGAVYFNKSSTLPGAIPVANSVGSTSTAPAGTQAIGMHLIYSASPTRIRDYDLYHGYGVNPFLFADTNSAKWVMFKRNFNGSWGDYLEGNHNTNNLTYSVAQSGTSFAWGELFKGAIASCSLEGVVYYRSVPSLGLVKIHADGYAPGAFSQVYKNTNYNSSASLNSYNIGYHLDGDIMTTEASNDLNNDGKPDMIFLVGDTTKSATVPQFKFLTSNTQPSCYFDDVSFVEIFDYPTYTVQATGLNFIDRNAYSPVGMTPKLADVNNDGFADLVVTDRFYDEVVVYLRNRTSPYTAPYFLTTPVRYKVSGYTMSTDPGGTGDRWADPTKAYFADINGDGKIDVVVPGRQTRRFYFFYGL